MKRRWIPLIVLCVSTALLLGTLTEYRQVFTAEGNVLADYAPPMPQTPPTSPAEPSQPDAPAPELPDNPVDFATLQEQYPHLVAWIQVPDTNINYAVMQSGSDVPEDFYLTHNEKGEKKRSGSIYIQRYNHADFSDPNTILYGHNMANGSMFADVHKFKKKDFFNSHEYLYVYLPGHVLTYRIYSLFSHNPRHLLWAYDFETEEGRQKFIDKTLNPKASIKRVRDGVSPSPADRLLTLSTCVDGSDDTDRLLLVAVLESDILTK